MSQEMNSHPTTQPLDGSFEMDEGSPISFNSGDSTSKVLKKVPIFQLVNHPCIINLEDVIDMPNFLFIVLELAKGGELLHKIIDETKLN